MPGTSTFQTTFWVSLQVSGRPGSSGMTPAPGPRNCGHWSAADIVVSARTVSATVVTSLRIEVLPLVVGRPFQDRSAPTLNESAYISPFLWSDRFRVASVPTLKGSAYISPLLWGNPFKVAPRRP